jgi:hypothetical protein
VLAKHSKNFSLQDGLTIFRAGIFACLPVSEHRSPPPGARFVRERQAASIVASQISLNGTRTCESCAASRADATRWSPSTLNLPVLLQVTRVFDVSANMQLDYDEGDYQDED